MKYSVLITFLLLFSCKTYDTYIIKDIRHISTNEYIMILDNGFNKYEIEMNEKQIKKYKKDNKVQYVSGE